MNSTAENPRNFTNIRAALYGEPWAITPDWLKKICAILETHARGETPDFENRTQAGAQQKEPDLPFDYRSSEDVAIVNISGPIFPKANLMTRLSGATALSEKQAAIQMAASIKPSAIILNVDSPGGSVMGLADFCEWLNELCENSSFPIIGLANPMAASAAYMILSQCDGAYATSGAIVGSIGTIMVMDNTDRAEKNAGNDQIVLRSSELKGVGNGPITPSQQQEMQRMLMMHDAKFQQAIARGRPGVDLGEVSTGQVWHGQSANNEPSAQDLGLIDGVSTLEDLVSAFGK